MIISSTGQFAGEALRLTGGEGVDVVYDGAGAETFRDSLASLRFHGVLACYGPLMKPLPPIDIFDLPKSVLITYPVVMHHVRTHEALVRRSNQLFDWVREGKLRVKIVAAIHWPKPHRLIRIFSCAAPRVSCCLSPE